MGNKKLLIAGIDPGTTSAIAILDIEGNLAYIHSSKQLDINQLISNTIGLGKVVLVGTDKAKVPSLVEHFAAKFGARIVSPSEDLKVDEKKKMAYGFEFHDDHQGDALASALLAYRETKQLLDKIDFFVKESKKQNIRDRIKEIVLTKRVSIKSAVSIIEKKDDDSRIMEKVIVEKKLNENDFLRLYNKLKRSENEIRLLKTYNRNLKDAIKYFEKNKIKKDKSVIDEEKMLDFREKRLFSLNGEIRQKNRKIEHLEDLIRQFNFVISGINNCIILKKLDTLGINELNFKNKILNIQKNDMLLVDDPNIFSNEAIGLLKDRIFIIVYRKQISKKVEESLPFVFIDAKRLVIKEDKYFGYVEKKHFEIEKSRLNWVKKIVEDYKREKEQLIS